MIALRNYALSIFLVLLLHTYIGECSDDKRMLLQDNYYTIESKLNNLTKDMEALKKEVGLSRHQPVSFMAFLTTVLPGQNHQIVFDDVKLNMGNAYHLSHGNFIVPVDGLYQFTITACSIDGHAIALELAINAVVVGKVLAGDYVIRDCNTGVFLERVSAGDDVYVKHETVGDYLDSTDTYMRPSFTGVLLNAL